MLENTPTEPYVPLPPTQTELPYDDGKQMESQRHRLQMDLLIDVLMPWLEEREDGFVGGNMYVYYNMAQVRHKMAVATTEMPSRPLLPYAKPEKEHIQIDKAVYISDSILHSLNFKGPDFFAVLGVPKGERRSWVVWEEGKAPDVVIELLSENTASIDKSEKKLIYQNQLRVTEYFWFDPFNPDDWAGFSLSGGLYQPLVLNEDNQLISSCLRLALQLWQGSYKGIHATWLRWATLQGELLPTTDEIAYREGQRAEKERQRADQERQRAEQERQRAEQIESLLLQTARNLLQRFHKE
ncbi:Uma2 family endonuclease [Chlorogloeopsis fritschii PCC 9212]|uniref:Putative restriction endonuclease domain-containing protein n=1 Tax=Chlorogloeopsis fritschii PCC 6912 TaxID=211165 RepID=A0A3S0Y0S2_CHLFR|nr:Uma2 family endonuclease [Chlorogloeopsis fritschii]MBF2004749.1 Uma2 family endonuclease [Chlorogloeopsis fritschii C42_A2020_084]RUR85733.1 hypothetical protein PCC6912_05580 [Chlorogloeopsis fritschii PCC 6912]